jgi:hypothetical protein
LIFQAKYGIIGRAIETGEVVEIEKPTLFKIRELIEHEEADILAKVQFSKALERYFVETERREADKAKMSAQILDAISENGRDNVRAYLGFEDALKKSDLLKILGIVQRVHTRITTGF